MRARSRQRCSAAGCRHGCPSPDTAAFAGERRLRDDQIALIAKWADSDAPEGNPADAPTPPVSSSGWQLGTPDLVLPLTEPYVLRPGGRDVFRNFVLPVPITATRYVRAVEFRADRPQVLHHADLALDVTRVSRRSIAPTRGPDSPPWTAVRCRTCTAGRRARCR